MPSKQRNSKPSSTAMPTEVSGSKVESSEERSGVNVVESLDWRLRLLVELHTTPTRRNAQMAELTGVAASQWASWWVGRARPSAEVLVATCTALPEFALWLMTGVDDPIGGQLGPDSDWKPTYSVKLLRQLTMYAAAYRETGAMHGIDVSSDYVADELNMLLRLRARELMTRLNERYGDQAA